VQPATTPGREVAGPAEADDGAVADVGAAGGDGVAPAVPAGDGVPRAEAVCVLSVAGVPAAVRPCPDPHAVRATVRPSRAPMAGATRERLISAMTLGRAWRLDPPR